MAETFTFELVSPERLLMSREVTQVVVPGEEGDFGVLPLHAPFMSAVRPGIVEVYVQDGGQPEKLFVGGGFADVSGDRLTILAEQAMPLEKADAEAASRELADAREDLADAKDDQERARLEAQIARLEALLAALKS